MEQFINRKETEHGNGHSVPTDTSHQDILIAPCNFLYGCCFQFKKYNTNNYTK